MPKSTDIGHWHISKLTLCNAAEIPDARKQKDKKDNENAENTSIQNYKTSPTMLPNWE